MWSKGFRQPERIAVGDEAGVDLRRRDPAAAFGHPHRRMLLAAEAGPDVVDVVGDRLHRPAHHRGHVAASRRLAAHRLAVAHVQHPEPAELRRRRVAAPVNDIQLRRLGAPQPPRVNHLEQRRVPVGGQCALAFRPHRTVDLLVGVVEEPLQLLAGERAGLRIALVVVEMRDRVPLVADRHRMHPWPELLLTHRSPAVAGVAEVLAEQPQIGLVAADRRRRQMRLRHQRLRPLVDMPRQPTPRVLVGELDEPAHQPLPRRDGVFPQPARRLLGTPAAQHRLQHGVFRAQLHHPGDELKMCCTRQIRPSHICLQPRIDATLQGKDHASNGRVTQGTHVKRRVGPM